MAIHTLPSLHVPGGDTAPAPRRRIGFVAPPRTLRLRRKIGDQVNLFGEAFRETMQNWRAAAKKYPFVE